jgi:hypothetical protein
MDKKRFYEYRRRIAVLQERDKHTSLRVQNELNKMDAKEKELEKETREKLLHRKKYEIEKDKENYFVNIRFYDDKKETCTTCSLWGEYFERMEYENTSPNPCDVREKGKENIFSGDNADTWEDYEVFEIFFNNIFKFSIKIEEY